MDELFRNIADTMAIKIRVINIVIDTYENKRECPFYSELVGMELALKTLGIEFEYTFNVENGYITSVTVMGYTVVV